jgi:hypothetical protein
MQAVILLADGLSVENNLVTELHDMLGICILCHNGMGHPHTADRDDNLQIWKVTANTFNKQSHTACGFHRQLPIPNHENQHVTEHFFVVSWTQYSGKLVTHP